jgi:hypothetical protein
MPALDLGASFQFGGLRRRTSQLPADHEGLELQVGLFTPRPEILDGRRRFPEAEPVN